MKIYTFIFFFLLLNNLVYLGQIHNVQAPLFKQYNTIEPNQFYQNKPVLSSKPQKNSANQYHSTTQPQKVYQDLNKTNYTLGNNTFVPPKQTSSVNYVKSLIKEDQKINKQLSYSFPRLKNKLNVEYFEKAYQEIVDMLEGKSPLSLKKAKIPNT